MRVLLVEDDATLQRGLQQALEDAGHKTIATGDGQYADTLLATESFDLVVLDLGLPGLSGLSILQRLRNRHQGLPVLIVSARDRTEDRVRGLDTGADDYLVKPFDLSEFDARVRALLRRGQSALTRVADLDWSWENRRAHVHHEELPLSNHETIVLETLLNSLGKIVAKEEIALKLGSEGAAARDNMVEVYIHRLRRKLADAGVEIRTVRGLGYLLREAESAPSTHA